MESTPAQSDLADAIAQLGTIASFVLIFIPLPQFNFWGLNQKEKEQRMEQFPFSYMILNVMNCILWFAYAVKIHDENLAIPNGVGALIAVILMCLYLSVSRSRDQILTCLFLCSITNMSFSNMLPAFMAGSLATGMSISANFSTLVQLRPVMQERSSRFINLPIVMASLTNNALWFSYSILKGNVCVFSQTLCALLVMTTNLLFFFWADGKVSTATLRPLINFVTLFIGEVDKLDKDDKEEDGAVKRQNSLDGPLVLGGKEIKNRHYVGSSTASNGYQGEDEADLTQDNMVDPVLQVDVEEVSINCEELTKTNLPITPTTAEGEQKSMNFLRPASSNSDQYTIDLEYSKQTSM